MEITHLALIEAEPGRHVVTAAAGDNASLACRDHGAAEPEPRNGPARPLAAPVRAKRHDTCRLAKHLAKASGDDADHALMPVRVPDQHHRPVSLFCRHIHGMGTYFLFDLAAADVQLVKRRGEAKRLIATLCRKQAYAEVGRTDPPAGIDPRPEHEPEGMAARRGVETRHVGKAGQTDIAAARQHLQPLPHKGAVDPPQRHHIADRSKPDKIELAHKVGCLPATLERTAAAQLAKQRDKQDEHDAGGAEMAIGAILVQTVRVDHAMGARQFRSGKMMIDDNHIHAGLRHLLERPVRGNSAIHRNNQPGAAFLQGGERRLVGAIALAHPVRDMHIDSQPQRAKYIDQQPGGGGTVDIIVSEHTDRRTGLDGIGKPRRALVHILEN